MSSRDRIARERQARIDRILVEAERLFVEKGYASTTVDDIARHAEFSRTALYQYFRCKEDMYASILERYTDLLTDRVAEATARASSTPEKIRAFLGEIRHMIREKPGFFELYFIQRHQVQPRLSAEWKTRLNEKRRRLENVFREAYQEGIRKGEVRPIRFKDASNLFFAQVMGMMLLHEYYGDEFDVSLDEHLEQCLTVYLEFVQHLDGRRPLTPQKGKTKNAPSLPGPAAGLGKATLEPDPRRS